MHSPAKAALPCFQRSGHAARLRLFAALLLPGILSGCAALTNPVVDGIPVRRLPPELLAESRDGEQTVPLNLLRQKSPDAYRLGPGDVVGVWIPGVLPVGPQENQLPPVSFSQRGGARFPEREEPPPAL